MRKKGDFILSCNFSQGINDCNRGIQILTTRIFDNVRMDLDRRALNLQTNITAQGVTALYASGTGVIIPDSSISVIPNINDSFATVTGTLFLPGTVTYIFEGTKSSTCATLELPINMRMILPDDSVWPFDVTVHYSYFADNLEETTDNNYTALVDGVIIVYVTACMPVTLNDSCPIQYNSISQRTVLNQNNFTASTFYPQTKGSSVMQ